jgi:methionine-rich copper-binding protein CopC
VARRRIAILVTMVSLSISLPTLAHGTFVDARPLPGVVVGGVVDEVSLLFPEPIVSDSAVIAVTGPDGRSVSPRGGVQSPVPSAVTVAIEALSLPGEHRIDHVVTSQDGFVFEGSFTFVYDPAAPALDPLPYGRDPLPWVWLLGIAMGLGLISWTIRHRGVRHVDGV